MTWYLIHTQINFARHIVQAAPSSLITLRSITKDQPTPHSSKRQTVIRVDHHIGSIKRTSLSLLFELAIASINKYYPLKKGSSSMYGWVAYLKALVAKGVMGIVLSEWEQNWRNWRERGCLFFLWLPSENPPASFWENYLWFCVIFINLKIINHTKWVLYK